MIHGQSVDSCSAGACHSFEMDTVCRPTKMAAPALPPRMKEKHYRFRCRIVTCLKIQLPKLTGIAAQRQIRERRGSTSALRDYVVQTQSMWEEALGSMAVLTSMAGSPGHAGVEASQFGFALPHSRS
jgi:hypothetical protein